MKTIFYFFVVAATFLTIQTQQASAAMTPLAVSIAPPVQFPPSNWDIVGLRLNALWGKHRDVRGIDLGLLANQTTGKFTGIAVAGGANITGGDTTALGLQL